MILKHILLKPYLRCHPFKSVNLIKEYSLFTVNKSNNLIYTKNSIASKRLFFSKKKISAETYRINDKLSSDYTLIYKTTLNRYVTLAQYVAISTLIGTGFTLLFSNEPNSKIFNEISTSLVNIDNQLVYFTIALILTNLAIMVLIVKIPYRIYFNETTKMYTGVKPTIIPSKSAKFQFKPGQLIQHEGGILPWKQFEYKIKNGPTIILLDQYFRRPQDMNIMLGYTIN